MRVESRAAAFEAAGFLVIPNFAPPAEIAALRARAEEIVEGFDPRTAGAVFTTRDDAKTKAEEYFLTSGTAVRCFFEEEAFDAAGVLRGPKQLSINKIGHAMHDLDPVFEDFSHDARLQALAAELGLAEPQLYQSMYIFKQPRIGGEVRWHQEIGMISPLYAGATGRAILAYILPEELKEFWRTTELRRLTPYTKVNRKEVLGELEVSCGQAGVRRPLSQPPQHLLGREREGAALAPGHPVAERGGVLV